MYELSSPPSSYCSKRRGVVRLFPGAEAVLRRLATDTAFEKVQIAVASSTTEPAFAKKCLESFPLSGSKFVTIDELVRFKQIYPGSKAAHHFPKLKEESGIPYDEMIFFDDCTYSDNCADVASRCHGTTCMRTPSGLTEDDFELALSAFAAGKRGVI
ncbi:Magnesium-dependent phosphatase 1 (MDP-1) [Durusdinium trenchii]|uniref:Magnesium-dependent phosphatase 1 (MDP-1) n=1 Tax=Durusdinium trenchii TaxID=1381693 RepID=A0ABP0NBA6_9DINO